MLTVEPASRFLQPEAFDPSRLMARMGNPADPWQSRVLRSPSKRVALLKARQVGGSTVLVARGLHRAAYFPGSTVGILSPSLRQSARLLRRIRRALVTTPHVTATNRATNTLTLSNGSEVVAWPGAQPDMIRGDSLDLLLADESAWVLPAAFTATLPMLAVTNGAAVLASSPGGPSGFMFDLWNDDETEWERVTVRASDCPRYSPDALASLRRSLGETGYATEFECEWREGANSVFTADELARILGVDPVPDVLPGEDPLPDDDAEFVPSLVLPSLSELLSVIRSDERAGA